MRRRFCFILISLALGGCRCHHASAPPLDPSADLPGSSAANLADPMGFVVSYQADWERLLQPPITDCQDRFLTLKRFVQDRQQEFIKQRPIAQPVAAATAPVSALLLERLGFFSNRCTAQAVLLNQMMLAMSNR